MTLPQAVRELLAGRLRLVAADGTTVELSCDDDDGGYPLGYGEGMMLTASWVDVPPGPNAVRVEAVFGRLSPMDPVDIPPDDGGDPA